MHAARELPNPVETYAIYTDQDENHVHLGNPHHALRLPSPASYTDIEFLVNLVKAHSIDAVHPGYGFLSESSQFVRQVWEKATARVVGPGWAVLEKTGDKLQAKQLAMASDVPILPATQASTNDVEDLRLFAANAGFPIMIKAVDGGGGRGIRLVRGDSELQQAFDRAVSESSSGRVFAEKAATDGFHHVEVQIVGDSTGKVTHLWERDCSVQRRYQKIVECSPAFTRDRSLVSKVIEAALRMAVAVGYSSLGTFEFLVNEKTSEYFFLEINPRIQVEHTITEQIASTDLVRIQLLLFQGLELQDVGLGRQADPKITPNLRAIQMRLCAEDPGNDFALSMGKITQLRLPIGHGVRVDTYCSESLGTVVGSEFDNLLAKIIVTDTSWTGAIRKSRRALQDTMVGGIKTNLELLQGITESEAFSTQDFDNQWLEANFGRLCEVGKRSRDSRKPAMGVMPSLSSASASVAPSSNVLFRKGEAWTIALSPIHQSSLNQNTSHHLLLEKVLRNEFPTSVAAEIAYTVPSGEGALTKHYQIEATSTQNSAAYISSTHRRGDPSNSCHVMSPISGKLIEVLIDTGDGVERNQVIAYVKQMKMELEVRSPRAGRAVWALELENAAGEDIAEGVLLAELEDLPSKNKEQSLRGKL